MTREELVGELMQEGFPRDAAEHEADVIQGGIIDDTMPQQRVRWDLLITVNAKHDETTDPFYPRGIDW